MTDLDRHYSHLLAVGFVMLRQAAESDNREWLDAELEMLHNVPSLIGEKNPERHAYFWSRERAHYVEWVSMPGREQAKSRMLTYYKPTWDEMAPLVAQLIAESAAQQGLAGAVEVLV